MERVKLQKHLGDLEWEWYRTGQSIFLDRRRNKEKMNREWTTILEYEIEGGCGRKVKGGGWGLSET